MKGEKVGNTTGNNTGANGWESVAANAGKFNPEAAKKAVEKDGSKKEANKQEVEQDLLSIGLLADHSGSQFRKLNKLRQAEAEYSFKAESSTPSAIAQARDFKEQADKLEQEIRDRGAAMLEAQAARQRKAAEEAATATDSVSQEKTKKGSGGFLKKLFGKKEKAAEPTSTIAEAMQNEKPKNKSIAKMASEYCMNVGEITLLRFAKNESREIAKLAQQYDEAKPGSRLKKKLQRELARHGRTFGPTTDYSEYTALSQPDRSIYDDSKTKAMRGKARDWMVVKLTLEGKDGRKTKKRFKKHGLPTKCPTHWSDGDVTCHEMSSMANLCYGAYKEQE